MYIYTKWSILVCHTFTQDKFAIFDVTLVAAAANDVINLRLCRTILVGYLVYLSLLWIGVHHSHIVDYCTKRHNIITTPCIPMVSFPLLFLRRLPLNSPLVHNVCYFSQLLVRFLPERYLLILTIGCLSGVRTNHVNIEKT